jgi:hypothetical protein
MTVPEALPGPSRRAFLQRGVALGCLVTAGGAVAVLRADPAAAARPGFRWCSWCSRCQGVWFVNGANSGRCPAEDRWDHRHRQNDSYAFSLKDGSDPALNHWRWSWCVNCRALFVLDWGAGRCPSGSNGQHSPAADRFSIDYADNHAPVRGQAGWNCCLQCSGLFWPCNGLAVTRCSVGGIHDPTGTATYYLPY